MAASSIYRITSLISDDRGCEGMARAIVRISPDAATITFRVGNDDTLEVISCQTRAERRLMLAILETMSRQMKQPA